MTAVTPFLWFDNTAEEAIRFYTELIRTRRSCRSRTTPRSCRASRAR